MDVEIDVKIMLSKHLCMYYHVKDKIESTCTNFTVIFYIKPWNYVFPFVYLRTKYRYFFFLLSTRCICSLFHFPAKRDFGNLALFTFRSFTPIGQFAVGRCANVNACTSITLHAWRESAIDKHIDHAPRYTSRYWRWR